MLQWRATAAETVWNGRECRGEERVALCTCNDRVGREGREGGYGMGVNERASEEGSSLQTGSVRSATQGSEWRTTCTLQATQAHCFSPPSMKSLPFHMVSDEVEKVWLLSTCCSLMSLQEVARVIEYLVLCQTC